MALNQPLEIELDILKSRIDTLEANQRWLTNTWVGWTSSTKDMGQKIMIALEQIVKDKNATDT
jgi:hypothetical protein